MMLTGSGRSPITKARGQTSRRNAIVQTRSASPYRARNLVEHFFNKIKHRRRIATRYDKLAAIRIWLRAYESTSLGPLTTAISVWQLPYRKSAPGAKINLIDFELHSKGDSDVRALSQPPAVCSGWRSCPLRS